MPETELREKLYFYGDLCAFYQSECEFGKASVEKRNLRIRESGDELLAKIELASQRQVIEARLDELERRYGSTNHGARWEERFDELTAQLSELKEEK